MKKAIIFGAGSIGRGFIGQIFSQSGYEVVFVDINKNIVDELNLKRSYSIRIISDKQSREIIIDNVRALNIDDKKAVIREIVTADILSTSVGASALPEIAKTIAVGVIERFKIVATFPINILICENLMDAAGVMKKLVRSNLSGREKLLDDVGFVETSIGRMVPVMTKNMQGGNILRIWVEPYCELPVDSKGFVGKIPDIKNMIPFTPFQFYKEEKLYIHNLGHSVASYLGYLYGYKYIWQCVNDKFINYTVKEAMSSSAAALSKSYDFPKESLDIYVDDLMNRFNNKKLKDTVKRGCRDPLRKLKPDDRFVGAVNKCKNEEINFEVILKVVASVLLYKSKEDKESYKLREMINNTGVTAFLKEYCLLDEKDAQKCDQHYKQFLNLKIKK